MTFQISDLADFGWNHFFGSQLEPEDLVCSVPVRVLAVHRGGLSVAGPGIGRRIPPFIGNGDDEPEKNSSGVGTERAERNAAQDKELQALRRQIEERRARASRLEAERDHAHEDLEAVRAELRQEQESGKRLVVGGGASGGA